jgi:hypothetical protein
MRTRTLLAALAIAVVSASAARAQTAEIVAKIDTDLNTKRLQGEWVPDLQLRAHGARAYPFTGRMLVFDNGTFTRFEAKQAVAMGKYKIEEGFLRLAVESSSPWDLESPEPRKNLQYAFHVEGDVLTLCYTVGDKGTANDLTPGDRKHVVVYKRQKQQ